MGFFVCLFIELILFFRERVLYFLGRFSLRRELVYVRVIRVELKWTRNEFYFFFQNSNSFWLLYTEREHRLISEKNQDGLNKYKCHINLFFVNKSIDQYSPFRSFGDFVITWFGNFNLAGPRPRRKKVNSLELCHFSFISFLSIYFWLSRFFENKKKFLAIPCFYFFYI